MNQAKRFSVTSEDLMITLQKMHAYVIKNNKHTFHIIHTHYLWKRKYMHNILMDDLYTQRLLIFALFATAPYFLNYYNYKQKVFEALEINEHKVVNIYFIRSITFFL